MFKGCEQFISANTVIKSLNQKDLFLKYLNIYPEENKFYYSPFRHDRSPKCRFKWHNGLLYFVENTMFNNKLYWNIFDIIMYFNSCSYYEALQIINKDFKIEKDKIQFVKQSNSKRPEIRFTHTEWQENLFGLPNEVLINENVYLVKDYFIKKENNYIKNGIHNPRKTTCIAYYFPDTNHVKLYFPEQKDFRWYSNCDVNDIFGKYKLNYYSQNYKFIILTKSQKDRLMLDYKLGFPAIATQNEGSFLSDDFVLKLKFLFEKVYILYDNDEAGKTASKKLSELYGFIPFFLEYKDVYESLQNKSINNLITEICHNLKLEM